jgi:hypothetical protein
MNQPPDDSKARVALFQKREIRPRDARRRTTTSLRVDRCVQSFRRWKKVRKHDLDLSKPLKGGGQFVPPFVLVYEALRSSSASVDEYNKCRTRERENARDRDRLIRTML